MHPINYEQISYTPSVSPGRDGHFRDVTHVDRLGKSYETRHRLVQEIHFTDQNVRRLGARGNFLHEGIVFLKWEKLGHRN